MRDVLAHLVDGMMRRLSFHRDRMPPPIAMHGLPHAYRDVAAPDGTTGVIEVTGASGGIWKLSCERGRWTLAPGGAEVTPAAGVKTSADTAWRMFFNGLAPADAAHRLELTGAPALTTPLLHARSVIV